MKLPGFVHFFIALFTGSFCLLVFAALIHVLINEGYQNFSDALNGTSTHDITWLVGYFLGMICLALLALGLYKWCRYSWKRFRASD